jgi:DNA replication protein DnaC
MKALIDVLISSFQDSNDERLERKDLYERYMNCDLLILDEVFDRSKVILYASGYQIPFLDQFIRSRLDMMKKGILFISNKAISQIASEGFGESLQDLIERKVILRNANLTFSDRVFDSISKNNFTGTFD